MSVRLVHLELFLVRATMLLAPVRLVQILSVLRMNTYRIIIVYRVLLERLVEEVLPVEKILFVMSFYAETMNTP
jgi:hypothetical protein